MQNGSAEDCDMTVTDMLKTVTRRTDKTDAEGRSGMVWLKADRVWLKTVTWRTDMLKTVTRRTDKTDAEGCVTCRTDANHAEGCDMQMGYTEDCNMQNEFLFTAGARTFLR